MDYSIKEYALIRFSMEGQPFVETLALDPKTDLLPAKLKELADAYKVTEFTVHRRFVLTAEGEQEEEQHIGIVVDSE